VRYIPLFATGTILALILGLQGEHPLHASAVAVDGRAIAIAGASGSGKSTLAAKLCIAGASFVTDDLLRLTRDGGCIRPPANRLATDSGQLRVARP